MKAFYFLHDCIFCIDLFKSGWLGPKWRCSLGLIMAAFTVCGVWEVRDLKKGRINPQRLFLFMWLYLLQLIAFLFCYHVTHVTTFQEMKVAQWLASLYSNNVCAFLCVWNREIGRHCVCVCVWREWGGKQKVKVCRGLSQKAIFVIES